ncbi:hypothetical protein PR048_002400 [Dryococelus australis]|uniref:Uncharacterized protein n=1 Tax=Dryococelus australis TaxID=614101 RepID=A0ABQ9ILH8_9NEOP|nr:hypothetical protein PR048_002400 [Dryococelus australis]
MRGRGNGRYPRKPDDQRYRLARFPYARICERPRRESNPVHLDYSSVGVASQLLTSAVLRVLQVESSRREGESRGRQGGAPQRVRERPGGGAPHCCQLPRQYTPARRLEEPVSLSVRRVSVMGDLVVAMLSYMLPVEDKPPPAPSKTHLELQLQQQQARALSNGRAAASSNISSESSVSSFSSSEVASSTASHSTVTPTDKPKPKLIINGTKHHAPLKRHVRLFREAAGYDDLENLLFVYQGARLCKALCGRENEVSVEQRRKQGREKRKIPEKTRRPAASFGTIPTCENSGMTPPRIEPGSPWWEASSLATIPPRPLKGTGRSCHSELGVLSIFSNYGNRALLKEPRSLSNRRSEGRCEKKGMGEGPRSQPTMLSPAAD